MFSSDKKDDPVQHHIAQLGRNTTTAILKDAFREFSQSHQNNAVTFNHLLALAKIDHAFINYMLVRSRLMELVTSEEDIKKLLGIAPQFFNLEATSEKQKSILQTVQNLMSDPGLSDFFPEGREFPQAIISKCDSFEKLKEYAKDYPDFCMALLEHQKIRELVKNNEQLAAIANVCLDAALKIKANNNSLQLPKHFAEMIAFSSMLHRYHPLSSKSKGEKYREDPVTTSDRPKKIKTIISEDPDEVTAALERKARQTFLSMQDYVHEMNFGRSGYYFTGKVEFVSDFTTHSTQEKSFAIAKVLQSYACWQSWRKGCDIYLMSSDEKEDKQISDNTHLRLYYENNEFVYYLKDNKGLITKYTLEELSAEQKRIILEHQKGLLDKNNLTSNEKMICAAILTITSKRNHTRKGPEEDEKYHDVELGAGDGSLAENALAFINMKVPNVILVDLADGENIKKPFLKLAEMKNTPIIIKKNNKYSIYGCKDKKWGFTEITDPNEEKLIASEDIPKGKKIQIPVYDFPQVREILNKYHTPSSSELEWEQFNEDLQYHTVEISPALAKRQRVNVAKFSTTNTTIKGRVDHALRNTMDLSGVDDIYLLDKNNDEKISDSLLKKAEDKNIPILIRQNKKFQVYTCQEDGKWAFVDINDPQQIESLNSLYLPFKERNLRLLKKEKVEVHFGDARNLLAKHDLWLLDQTDDKPIDNILKKARETNTPILIRQNKKFKIYGCNEDGNWDFTDITTSQNVGFINSLNLPFKNGERNIISFDELLKNYSSIGTILKKGHARLSLKLAFREGISFAFSNEMLDMFAPQELRRGKDRKVQVGLIMPVVLIKDLSDYFKLPDKEITRLISLSTHHKQYLDKLGEEKLPEGAVILSRNDFLKLHKQYAQEKFSATNIREVFKFIKIYINSDSVPDVKLFLQDNPEFLGRMQPGNIRYANTSVKDYLNGIYDLMQVGAEVITVDYGDSDPLADDSSLRVYSYLGGASKENPLITPGHRDITYSVNMSIVGSAGARLGLQIVFFGKENELLTAQQQKEFLDEIETNQFKQLQYSVVVQRKTGSKVPDEKLQDRFAVSDKVIQSRELSYHQLFTKGVKKGKQEVENLSNNSITLNNKTSK